MTVAFVEWFFYYCKIALTCENVALWFNSNYCCITHSHAPTSPSFSNSRHVCHDFKLIHFSENLTIINKRSVPCFKKWILFQDLDFWIRFQMSIRTSFPLFFHLYLGCLLTWFFFRFFFAFLSKTFCQKGKNFLNSFRFYKSTFLCQNKTKHKWHFFDQSKIRILNLVQIMCASSQDHWNLKLNFLNLLNLKLILSI